MWGRYFSEDSPFTGASVMKFLTLLFVFIVLLRDCSLPFYGSCFDICTRIYIMLIVFILFNILEHALKSTSYTWELSYIPTGLFSALSKLQSLDLFSSRYFAYMEEGSAKARDLEGLLQLNDVGLSIYEDARNVQILLGSDMLSTSTIKLEVERVDLTADYLCSKIVRRLKKLEVLRIHNCLENAQELVIEKDHFPLLKRFLIGNEPSLRSIILQSQLHSLSQLQIYSCDNLRDVACLWQLPSLEVAFIRECEQIVELLPAQPNGHNDQSGNYTSLSKLQCMWLHDLKSLVLISRDPLILPSLNGLRIEGCPSLKNLSIEPSSLRNTAIECEKEWWEGLEWEEGAAPPNRNLRFF